MRRRWGAAQPCFRRFFPRNKGVLALDTPMRRPPTWQDMDKPAQRTCKTCHKVLPIEAFPVTSKRPGARRPVCGECFNARRRTCHGASPVDRSKKSAVPPQPKPRKKVPASPLYLVTYAQNATPVHAAFLESMRTYCREMGARLLVIPGRYRNPTSMWSQAAEHDDWWDEALHPYLFAGRKVCGKHLTIYGDISIQPTDSRPANGFEAFCAEGSGVFGHPRLHLKTVASGRRLPRILTSTGACTVANYVPAKAGQKAAQLHCLGACVVEQDGELFHLRQIVADADGSFTDLDWHFDGATVTKAPPALSLTLGDIHVAKSDPFVLAATFGASGIVDTLDPQVLVLHDVLDWDARNHHERGRVDLAWDRRHGKLNDDAAFEVEQACAWLASLPRPAVVVRSNHDDAFDRWLHGVDPRTDPVNMLLWCETWAAKIRGRTAGNEWEDAFRLHWRQHWEERGRDKKPVRFLALDEPFTIGGVASHFHGHIGVNGARGSRAQFAKIGVPVTIGHSHSPGIEDRCWQAGVTGRLDMTYNALPSTWLNTHVVHYASGARCLLSVVDGRWRAMV